MITIDLNKGTIDVDLSEEEIEERLKAAKRPDHPAKGVLKALRSMVSGADDGAVWLYKD